jgi:uncharacterized protein YoxC
MDRRQALIVAFAGSAAVAIGGCDNGQRGFEDAVREYLAEIKTAFDDVQSKVDQFDEDNWRDVVDDLKSSMEDLNQKIADMQDWLDNPPEA